MRWFLVVGLAAVVGCRDAVTPVNPAAVRVALSYVSGGEQVDTVARVLKAAVVVLATDSTNRSVAVPSVVLNWFRIAGADTVFSGASLTGENGQAKFQWTLLQRAGAQRVVAWALDPETGAPAVYVEATATAVPDRPAAIQLKATAPTPWLGDTVYARALVASVTDRFGNGVTEPPVRLEASGQWTLVGDTAAVATAVGVSALTVVSDTARAQQAVAIRRDLRTLVGWTTSWACGDTTYSRQVAHRRSAGVVDSVQSVPQVGGHEWVLWSTAKVIQLNGLTQKWDTMTVRERIMVQRQEPTGSLFVPYLKMDETRMDLDGALTVWQQDKYLGGNPCLSLWAKGEPFTPLTIQSK